MKIRPSKYYFIFLIPIAAFATYFTLTTYGQKEMGNSYVKNIKLPEPKKDVNLKLLFAGDIFFDRFMDENSSKSKLGFAYPFSKLHTLERYKYDAWIGNLECPVTNVQSTNIEKDKYLKFSCKKEYLPELKNYFDIVSLANNHTDNMDREIGLAETRTHLDDAKIKHFGHFDPEAGENCKVINIKDFPIAFCGYHGVYKLPTEKDLDEIKKYSKYFFTVVMPHQGEEYKFKNNNYQSIIYRAMILNGADIVIGAHPHVIQNVEVYKGKYIFYSLGNFIFDQAWSKTREHMVLDLDLKVKAYDNPFEGLDCEKEIEKCLSLGRDKMISKPEVLLSVNPIFSKSGSDFVTEKWQMTDKQYQAKLKEIGFTQIDKVEKQ